MGHPIRAWLMDISRSACWQSFSDMMLTGTNTLEMNVSTGARQVGGQRRQPPADRCALALLQHVVEILLNQPGRPYRAPAGQRVPDRVIGQIMLLVPGGPLDVLPAGSRCADYPSAPSSTGELNRVSVRADRRAVVSHQLLAVNPAPTRERNSPAWCSRGDSQTRDRTSVAEH